MLFGGNPLPERPMWLRLLTVAMVLSVAWPLIGPTLDSLQDQFLKMSADDTEVYLSVYPLRANTAIGPDRDVRCEPGNDSWDYICTFAYRNSLRGKVGVRVGHDHVKVVSIPHPLDARHIRR